MVNLPKNCKLVFDANNVVLTATYGTTLPEGVHDGITVFRSCKSGKKFFSLHEKIKYQNNLPNVVTEKYFILKKKAMLFNRMKKQEKLQKEIDILSNSKFPGLWDIQN